MKTLTTSPRLPFSRLTGCALLAAASFAFASHAALAQTEPPQDVPPQAAPTATQNVDPPGRVARVNYMQGAVTTEPAGATDWSYASLNLPLTTGDQLWDDTNARSELHIGSTAVRLSASTSLDILNLDDTHAQLKVAQGTLSTHVRELPPGAAYEIDTPNVAVGVAGPGDYRVDVAPDGSTTTVTVREGSLTVYGSGGQLPMSAGQQITFSGANLQQVASNDVPPPDAFDQWAASRDAAEDRSISARYVSRDVPGYEDLDANGTWRDDPQYGAVWAPSAVPAGWAPYHEGHWVWQAPWGWTWVDDAPWGFAPYHYGRWVYLPSGWAWVPGPLVVSAPPVYAPALVAFVGGGGGGFSWGIDLTIGGAAAAGVAWFPLGPGEVWHPSWGGWSPRYYERVNQTVIINRTVNINTIHNTYVNYRVPGAVTAVPATAFVHGQPVMRFAQKVNPQQWRNPQFNAGAPGIAPVHQSFAPGLRAATYRPPQAAVARQVVATRSPAVPAAFHDQLAERFAQRGGQVPGAGAPVVRSAAPAGFAAQAEHGMPGVARNVQLVNLRSPVIAPAHGPAPGAQRPVIGEAAQHAPTAVERAQPSGGVPHPPQTIGNVNGAQHEGPREAGAMEPHAPGAQPHAEPGFAPARDAQQPAPRQEPRVPQAGGEPRPEFQQRDAQHAQPQPRDTFHAEQAPRAEPRPQPAQQHAEPRPEPHPQPQAHAEPHPEQHAEQHSSGSRDDHKHD
jgi:hypothetical protein